MQVVGEGGAVVFGELAHGVAERDLGAVGAIGGRTHRAAVAGGIVEVPVEGAKAEHDVGGIAGAIGDFGAQKGGAKVHDAHRDLARGEGVRVHLIAGGSRSKRRDINHYGSLSDGNA